MCVNACEMSAGSGHCGKPSGVKFMVGLDDLKNFFQAKLFYDSLFTEELKLAGSQRHPIQPLK